MVDFHESKLVKLIGPINNINKTFTTPSAFVAGSLRIFWNGQACESADERYGWEEVTDFIVLMKEAPIEGDELTCFYQDVCPIPGIWNCHGSPIDPRGIYP
jgi:hypothetical protein